jgi:hypothetical protein
MVTQGGSYLIGPATPLAVYGSVEYSPGAAGMVPETSIWMHPR